MTSTWDLEGADSWEDDEVAKSELNYSAINDINRLWPTLARLLVCIIQV
jgi:hypothetical protein